MYGGAYYPDATAKFLADLVICNAGGGFSYVGAMHDSFPHALELSKLGYNAFALIYRPGDAYEDLARAIAYICDHADELGVSRTGYSLWGGSASGNNSRAQQPSVQQQPSQSNQIPSIPSTARVAMRCRRG